MIRSYFDARHRIAVKMLPAAPALRPAQGECRPALRNLVRA
jgi:hypothetical protein